MFDLRRLSAASEASSTGTRFGHRVAARAKNPYYSGLTREVSRENRRQVVTLIGLVTHAPKGVPLRRGNLKTLRKLQDLQR